MPESDKSHLNSFQTGCASFICALIIVHKLVSLHKTLNLITRMAIWAGQNLIKWWRMWLKIKLTVFSIPAIQVDIYESEISFGCLSHNMQWDCIYIFSFCACCDPKIVLKIKQSNFRCATRTKSTNNLMPYFGLNYEIMVCSHKYQPLQWEIIKSAWRNSDKWCLKRTTLNKNELWKFS